VVDRPYGEFYDLYSVNPEYFGYHFVRHAEFGKKIAECCILAVLVTRILIFILISLTFTNLKNIFYKILSN
jgi:hypothetical protein